MRKKTLNNIYNTIKDIRYITIKNICLVSKHHEHTVRKAIKLMLKKGIISYEKIGLMKFYYIMKHKLLMNYTKQERDNIYYNYLKQFKIGVNLNKASKDIGMDKRSFRKEIKRLIKRGIVTEYKLSNMIIYRVVKEWKQN